MEKGGTEDDFKVSGLGNLLSDYLIKKTEWKIGLRRKL